MRRSTPRGEQKLEVEMFGIMIHCWVLLLFLCRVLSTALYVTTDQLISTTDVVTTASNAQGTNPRRENCNTTVAVGFQAKPILLPKTEPGNPIYCWWLLEASHVDQKIGISSHTTTFDVGPNDYFVLQARDGANTTSRLLANIKRVKSDKFFKDVSWLFQRTMVSSTNHLLIEYKNNGNNALQMEILHYTCGGTFSSDMYVSSPKFSNEYARQPYVECFWTLIKPKDALYGLLKLRYIHISECASLAISTKGSLKYIANQWTNESNFTTVSDADPSPTTVFDDRREKNIVAKSANKEDFSEDLQHDENGLLICEKSIKIVAFDGDCATLSFRIDNASSDIGFAAQYNPVRVHKGRKPVVKKPWYINYFGLVICTPIGIVIGTAIILFQSKRSKPSKNLDMLLIDQPPPSEGFRYSPRKAETSKPDTKTNERTLSSMKPFTELTQYKNRSVDFLCNSPMLAQQSKEAIDFAKLYSSDDTRLKCSNFGEESPNLNSQQESHASYIRRLSRSTGNLTSCVSVTGKRCHFAAVGTKKRVMHHKHKALLTDGTKTM